MRPRQLAAGMQVLSQTSALVHLDLSAATHAAPDMWRMLNCLCLPNLMTLSLNLCRMIFMGAAAHQKHEGGLRFPASYQWRHRPLRSYAPATCPTSRYPPFHRVPMCAAQDPLTPTLGQHPGSPLHGTASASPASSCPSSPTRSVSPMSRGWLDAAVAANGRLLGSLITLRSLEVAGTDITDAAIPHVARLTGLSKLDLSACWRLSAAAVAAIAALTGLRSLAVSEVALTGACAAFVPLRGLTALVLASCGMCDADLETAVRGKERLRLLQVEHAEIRSASDARTNVFSALVCCTAWPPRLAPSCRRE